MTWTVAFGLPATSFDGAVLQGTQVLVSWIIHPNRAENRKAAEERTHRVPLRLYLDPRVARARLYGQALRLCI